jgi:hypothetical protein
MLKARAQFEQSKSNENKTNTEISNCEIDHVMIVLAGGHKNLKTRLWREAGSGPWHAV